MDDWKAAVTDCTDEKLDSWSSELTHITIHNAYHLGQVVYIRKQQGSWNETKGVH